MTTDPFDFPQQRIQLNMNSTWLQGTCCSDYPDCLHKPDLDPEIKKALNDFHLDPPHQASQGR